LLTLGGVGRRVSTEAGFTLIEMVIVLMLIGMVTAMALPVMQNFNGAIALGGAQRTIASELQLARMKSVTSNRVMRVRFNCPAPNQLRTLELIGTSSIPAPQDTAPNRCNPAVYPFPAADNNPVTFPNLDGPVRMLDSMVSLGAVQTIEFRPTGMAYSVNADGTATVPLTGNGVDLTVTKGNKSKTITVNALGRINAQQ
jgi:prepilin-type N-terminal cleavage/methylation domain-containing protein